MKVLRIDINYEYLNSEIISPIIFNKITIFSVTSSGIYDVEPIVFLKIYLYLIKWRIENIRQFFYNTQNKWINSIKLVPIFWSPGITLHITRDFKTKSKLCDKQESGLVKNNTNARFGINADLDLIYLLKFLLYILFVYFNKIFAFVGMIANLMVVAVIRNMNDDV